MTVPPTILPIQDLPSSREDLESLARSGDPVQLHISRTHRVIQASPSVEAILGYPPAEVLGLAIHELCYDTNSWRAFLQALKENRGNVRQYPMRLKGRLGNAPWVLINASGDYLGDAAEINLEVQKISHPPEDVVAIRRSRDRLRDLFAYEQKVRDDEKARLARELHDGLGGVLTLLTINLSRLSASLPPQLQSQSQDLKLLVDQAVAITRGVVTSLHPPILDNLGLCAAIAWQAEELQRHSGIACRVNCRRNCDQLDRERALALFRLIQEALTNVVRHAQADEVVINCHEEEGHLSLSIQDNGAGMAQDALHKPGSYGIRGMLERIGHWGGTLSFDSTREKGATLNVRLPLAQAENAS